MSEMPDRIGTRRSGGQEHGEWYVDMPYATTLTAYFRATSVRGHAEELRKGIEELQEAFKRREAQPTKGQKRTMSFCVDCSIQHLFDLLTEIREAEGK